MVPSSRLSALLADPVWRYGIVAGLLTLPFTAASLLQSMDELSLGAAGFGALVAGYLHSGRSSENGRAGRIAAVVGALPGVWMLGDMFWFVLFEVANPAWFRAVQVGLVFVLALLVFGLAAAVGTVNGMVGGWLAGKTGRRPAPNGG